MSNLSELPFQFCQVSKAPGAVAAVSPFRVTNVIRILLKVLPLPPIFGGEPLGRKGRMGRAWGGRGGARRGGGRGLMSPLTYCGIQMR